MTQELVRVTSNLLLSKVPQQCPTTTAKSTKTTIYNNIVYVSTKYLIPNRYYKLSL